MKVAVIGSGYVGLVTSLGFAKKNIKVTNIDIDVDKVQKIKIKKPDIFEPGLKSILSSQLNKNYFVTEKYSECLKSDIIFIAVNTPHKNNGIDLSYLISACKKIKNLILKNKVKKKIIIVIKSTVVPGTLELKIKPIFKNLKNIFIANNPEFLREGSAIKDFLEPDRIIIGSNEKYALRYLKKIYSKFKSKTIFVSSTEAELCKYFSNIILSNLIAFSNEFSDVCEKFEDVSYLKILESFMYDRRFRIKKDKQIIFPDIYKYLIPGPGYGGSCFPKDTKSFSKFSLSKGLDQKILNAIIFQNANRLKNKIKFLNNNLKKICIIGVGFKEGTSDLRESKSLELMKILKSKNKSVYYIDQNVNLKNKNYTKINFQDLFKTKIDAVFVMNHSKYTLKFNWKKFTENKKVTVFDFRAKLQPTKRIKVIGSNF